MAEPFDPYYKWLGIPADEQPPHYYRLLALRLFEPDADVVEAAAEQRMAHVRIYQTGPYAGLSQRILNELAAARICLLNPEKRWAYDQALRLKLTSPPPIAVPIRPPALPVRPNVATEWQDPTAVPLDFVTEGEAHRLLTRRRGGRERSPVGALVGVSAIVLAAIAIAFFVKAVLTRQQVVVSPVVEVADETDLNPASDESPSAEPATAEADEPPSFPKVDPHPVTLPDPPPDPLADFRERMRQFRENARRERKSAPRPTPKPAPESAASSKPTPSPETPQPPSEPSSTTPGPEPGKPQNRSRTLAERVARSMESRTLERSLSGGGGDGGTAFAEVPASGALLTGFNVTVNDAGGITCIQPVFVGVRGSRGGPGERHGTPRGRQIAVVAKRGYAVLAVRIQGDRAVDGLELEFARITANGLDQDDRYTSPWIGRRTADPALAIGGDGLPAVGIYGRAGAVVYSLGLVQLPAE